MKREFSKVIREPFERVFSITNIKARFSKCGIYPFNPGAIKAAKILPSASYGFANDSSTSSLEQSSASSPAPVPVCGESSRIWHSTSLSAISSGSNSDSNYPSSGLTTLSASGHSSGDSSLSSISTVYIPNSLSFGLTEQQWCIMFHSHSQPISKSWFNSTSPCGSSYHSPSNKRAN